MMPALLAERMEEFGLDYCVMYPTGGFATAMQNDDEIRTAACRAFNIFSAEYFADYADLMTPVAVIPMHTPDEAIEEIAYVRESLELKACLFSGMVPRSVPAAKEGDPTAHRLGSSTSVRICVASAIEIRTGADLLLGCSHTKPYASMDW